MLNLLSALVGAPTMPVKGLTATDISSIPDNAANITSIILNQSAQAQTPKVALNYILFDEQMRFVSGGVSKVKASDPANPGNGS